LSFMTPEAFTYYLPAFATAALSGRHGSGDIFDTLAWELTPAPDSSWDASVRARLALFTREEKRALEVLWRYYRELCRPDPANAE
jgi:hypothetical protein